jgi:lysophospholipid acyltransferase (LPLAT)-like uncharacterized protein
MKIQPMSTPALVKGVLRSHTVQWLISLLGAFYILLIQWSGRIDRPEVPFEGPYILALWHGRLGMLALLRNGSVPLTALISGHRDGQLISKCAGHFNITTVTGSTSHGGMRAVRELVRLARDGHSLFITPDGPRGPRMHVNNGILDLARLTGLPILPASIGVSRGHMLQTWDRFLIPLLFSRIVIRWGEPVAIDALSDMVKASATLEFALISLQHAVDTKLGRPLTEPA